MTIAKLPTSKHRRHKWDVEVKHMPAAHFPDGASRTERVCEHCGLRKVTVHKGDWLPRWEFYDAKGNEVRAYRTPPCNGATPE